VGKCAGVYMCYVHECTSLWGNMPVCTYMLHMNAISLGECAGVCTRVLYMNACELMWEECACVCMLTNGRLGWKT
jgi:hypothetical protein